ncbi:hypothetical protein ACJX0J_016721, partial [Zea mays]
RLFFFFLLLKEIYIILQAMLYNIGDMELYMIFEFLSFALEIGFMPYPFGLGIDRKKPNFSKIIARERFIVEWDENTKRLKIQSLMDNGGLNTIKVEIVNIFKDFFNGNLGIERLKYGVITLLPKVNKGMKMKKNI